MQTKRVKKDIHGVVLLDKHTGASSNKVLQKLKWIYKAKKAGHTGSLDPLATGLLPICFGQATKVTEYLLDGDKKYTTKIKLGEATDTYDAEGNVTESKLVNIQDEQLLDALENFKGNIKQVPPMFSALKKDGQPLYKLARKGEIIDRPARDMTVYDLVMERVDELHVNLSVHCSSGFYIRSLAHDFGQTLGCGAHVVELRRTESKGISVDHAHSLDSLENLDETRRNELILPIDTLLQHFPKIEINHAQSISLLQGRVTNMDLQRIDNEGYQTSELSRFYSDNGDLFGVGEINTDGQLKTHKMFIT